MRSFGRRFEVKNEMSDGGKIRSDEKTGGQANERVKEEYLKEASQVGFSDEEVFEQTPVKIVDTIREEYYPQNKLIYEELEQYYSDDVSNDFLQAYLTEKIEWVYGKELRKFMLATPKEMVETFLEYNDFEGVESYKRLTANIEETLSIMRENEIKKNEKFNQISLSEDESNRILSGYRNVMSRGELMANAYIAQQAKRLDVDKNALKRYVRELNKAKIYCRENVLHYHRTSLENAGKILEMGSLLNRANLKLTGVDTSKFLGSSSANVQFSVDKYDIDGKLYHEGFNVQDNLGASSSDVVFVFGPNLIDEETYDNFSLYPTVEKADIRECCATIMAKDDMVKEKLEKFLAENNYDIQVVLASEFNRENIITNMQEIEQEN